MQEEKLLDVFKTFFSDARGVCGTEKTFHALFYHHLMMNEWDATQIARELKLTNSGIVDFVLFDNYATGSFSKELPRANIVIEFKGGAYGNRNALLDEVWGNSEIRDIETLSALANDGLSAWFVCIDIPELGTALNADNVVSVSEQASRKNVNFVYYNQDWGIFIYRKPGERSRAIQLSRYETGPLPNNMQPAETLRSNTFWSSIGGWAHRIHGSEDCNAGLIYNQFRSCGLGAKQISLETYFKLATVNRSRMQIRPDITIYDSSMDGRFNLYQNGDTKKVNDAHKLRHLDALIEIKGSAATDKKSDNALLHTFSQDIEKLGRWKTLFQRAKAALGVNNVHDTSYVFVGIDNRLKALSHSHMANLKQTARVNKVDVLYIHNGVLA